MGQFPHNILFPYFLHFLHKLNEVKDDVHQAAKYMIEMEHKFIDMIFEQGDLENLQKEDLKEFIKDKNYSFIRENLPLESPQD